MRPAYGIVFDTFWTNATGRLIAQLGGPDALLTALYLKSSPHATMIGLYPLPLVAVRAHTGLDDDRAIAALDVLAEVGFAAYDFASAVVWVYDMAAERCRLTADRPQLNPDDNLVRYANRLYTTVVENLFLAEFFHRNRDVLHLKELRCANEPHQQLTLLEGLADQRSEDQIRVQRSERACGNVENRARPIARLATLHELIAKEAIAKCSPEATLPTVTESFKQLCRLRRIVYTPDSATRAIAGAIAERRKA